MRLRNVPKAPQILEESPIYIKDPTLYKGRWKSGFNNDNPVYIEIGCGKGRFIIEQARLHPDRNYIGIERYSSVLYKAVLKLEREEFFPENLKFICQDARELEDYFDQEEIEGIYLNFSDPWPKARHAKRRLTSPEFFERYKKILRHNGLIEFKTDNKDLYDYSLNSIDQLEEWNLESSTTDLHNDDTMRADNVMTEYEEKFYNQGKPICKLITRFLCLVFSLILFFSPIEAAAGEVWPKGVKTESYSVVVLEQNSGAVLYKKHPYKERYPASITKIMTALVAIENSEMDEVVKFSHDAVYLNEGDTSHISREVGEKMTMEQCLYGMMLESANECAWAIAEHVAGDVDSFVKMMNKRAKQIGCTHTHFANPNGLPQDDHYTCSMDMALISREAFNNKIFRTITGTRAYTIPPTNKHDVPTPLNNHHGMLNYYKTNKYLYDGCLGGKTGYTVPARNTLVTYAKRNDMTLVCVVMDAPSPGYYTDTIRLFDYCFDNFVTYPIAETGEPGTRTTKSLGKMADETQLFSVDNDATVVLPKTASVLDCTAEVIPLKKPVKGVIGNLEIKYADHIVGSGQLKFAESDEEYLFPFRNLQKEDDDEIVRIDFTLIGVALLCIIALAVVALFIRWLSPIVSNVQRRRRDNRRAMKKRYPLLRNNSRRRRSRRRRR